LFEKDGTCLESRTEMHLETVASQVVEFANWRRAAARMDGPVRKPATG
jgi:hypothetical protein